MLQGGQEELAYAVTGGTGVLPDLQLSNIYVTLAYAADPGVCG